MNPSDKILVIGSGIAGMEASLMLSKAGKKVYLVERLPLIGGNVIKTGESFPNMDCSTCLVAPIQQLILQDKNITVLTVSKVEKVIGKAGNFGVSLTKKARYVNIAACLGCGMCYPVCPVSQPNFWEQGLVEKKAIYVECAGSLPNVPVIDPSLCLRLNGSEECNLCAETCIFGAIDFSEKDELLEENFAAIIVATGFSTLDARIIKNLGYGKFAGVYTAYEIERLLASNGPTEGVIKMRDGERIPEKIAIIHCAGRKEVGYCSNVCCSYPSRYAHFLTEKVPGVKIFDIYGDLCFPDKAYQKLNYETRKEKAEYLFSADLEKLEISEESDKLKIKYPDAGNQHKELLVDMAILAVAITPPAGLEDLTELLEIERDKYGFVKAETGSVNTTRDGIYVAGCATGPRDIQSSVLQSEAAVGQILRFLQD
ncbi:MAG: NAD-binding protein [Candidatus Cloacimonetes bacterium]|nr:NAD-binding protein [Candidatus Cloacimonadota bacterium]